MRSMLLAVLVALAGCAGAVNGTLQVPPQNNAATRGLSNATAGTITHVIYVVQEGRSFDDLFQGYPGALTSSTGEISTGKTVTLSPISLKARYDIDTQVRAMFAACDGTGKLPGTGCRMNGFNEEELYGGPKGIKYPMYAYVPHEESKPYFDMAREWVVADHMFASQLDGSFTAHQYIVAAQSGHAVGFPTGSGGCEGGKYDSVATLTQRRRDGPNEIACFTYKTLANELERAHLSWRFYTPDKASSSFAFDKRVYGSPQWHRDVIQPPSQFRNDVASGKLANMTWVTPTCPDSDAVNCGGGGGPAWVASLVNAVGESKFWESHGHLRSMGRLGRLLRRSRAAVQRLRWPRLPGSAARNLGLRQARPRFARAVRNHERPALHGRYLRAPATRSGRHARPRLPPIASISPDRRESSSRSKRNRRHRNRIAEYTSS